MGEERVGGVTTRAVIGKRERIGVLDGTEELGY